MGILILYLLVNLWILCRLLYLKEDADIISLSYPAGGITESAFDQWKENEESGLFLSAAVWKNDGEHRILSEDTGHEQKVGCYQVKGWPEAIFGNELIQGRYFTEEEEDVCLLDQKTVQKLFGSEDVVGLPVSLDGTTFRIAGILEGNRTICVIPAEKETVFDGIAVQKKEKAQSFNQTVSLLEAALGGTKGQRIDGHLYYVTGWLSYAGIMALTLVLAGNIGKKWSGRRWILFLCLALSAGIFLLGIKIAAPGSDYLPSYWSDFEFWGRVFKEKAEQIQGLMAYQEFYRWQRMLDIWQQTTGAEILSGVVTVSVLFTVKQGIKN